jgi:DNA-binding NarL/FixJ family response regulator
MLQHSKAKDPDHPPNLGKIGGFCYNSVNQRKMGTQEQTWIENLTSREIEILNLISEGLTNREIAQRLVLSPETIKCQ